MLRIWILIVLVGTGGAQWRRFGEGSLAVAPTSLTRDMLALHNAVRSRVKTAPLAWSDRLASQSQSWADILLARKQFLHRPKPPFGENLFEITGGAASPAQVVRPGLRNLATTTTTRTAVTACVGITRKSSGARPEKWDAEWREA